jgi:hypothetical protein
MISAAELSVKMMHGKIIRGRNLTAVFCAAVILLVARPAYSQEPRISLIRWCLQAFESLVSSPVVPLQKVAIPPSEIEITELRRMQKLSSEPSLLKFKIDGITYTAYDTLGTGGEGTVYSARDGTGNRFAVKVFRQKSSMESALRGFHILQKQGVDTAQVVKVDMSANVVLFKFVDGMPIIDILDAARTNPTLKPLAEKLRPLAEELENRVKKDPRVLPHGGNVVYEIPTGRLVVIDPW